MTKTLAALMLAGLLCLGLPRQAQAGTGYAEVYRTWIVDTGSWRDGYGLFDYHVVYRWPKRSYRSYWYQTTGRARAAWLEMRVSGGLGPYTYADHNFYYREVTAGFRARFINPLSYGYAPYAYTSQLGDFAREFKIKYVY